VISVRSLCVVLFPWVAGWSVLSAAEWPVGSRVIVEKAGAGHRAIVLRSEPSRSYVAYEGVDDVHDEWVEAARIRGVRPPPPAPTDTAPKENPAPAPTELQVVDNESLPVPEPLPHALELPRASRGVDYAEIWLEQLVRKDPADPVRFSIGQLAVPQFRFGEVAGFATTKPPLATALWSGPQGVRGFAAIEEGVVLYRRDDNGRFEIAGRLDLASLQGFAPEYLVAADFNRDGETDFVVTAGPLVQVFFGRTDGGFTPSPQAFRADEPVRFPSPGRFFTGPLGDGVAVVVGFNRFRVLRVALSGVTAMGEPYQVKADRVTRLAAGDFDGDTFTDVAVTTESRGRSTGAWMFFNQRGAQKEFLWPVGGRDDFARDLLVADLDRDGRADLVLTDSDVEHGERVRVVFGSASRGWEDPWEVIGTEYALGLGTASIVVGDFNRDGRVDLGIGGRNGLRVYVGADYRRFSRNPVWPRLAASNDFPEQRVFLAGDFDHDGAVDLIGYTPAFATGYNVIYNATPTTVAGVQVPPPLHRRTPTQASTTIAQVQKRASEEDQPMPDGKPRVRFLGSRAEPYGQFRYRIVVEVAVVAASVVESVEGEVHYESIDQPIQRAQAMCKRVNDQQWLVEAILPRGRTYEFNVDARDDKGRKAEPLRVMVNP
jgi:hypothetical protein